MRPWYISRMEKTNNVNPAQLLDRFLRYVRIHTTSDRNVESIPSTSGQWDLLKLLESELRNLGIVDVDLSDKGYLIARIEPTGGGTKSPTIGFMAHVDTVSDVPGEGVKPRVHENYDGSAIELKGGQSVSPETDQELGNRIGDTVITSDGTTLLGADDKAGVAEIITAASWIVNHPEIPHGSVELIFTPDEETGKGMTQFPMEKLKSVCCYTLDGDVEGAVETECFNAEKSTVEFLGVASHPGTARGKLVNAVTMASCFVAMLPRSESPEATDGRFGFYFPLEISGSSESASVVVLIRDFEGSELERRKAGLSSFARSVESQFPGGRVKVKMEKQYTNMNEYLRQRPEVTELLIEAVEKSGIEPVKKIIRGGTDGSRLTEMGIPTPNIFTGGHNYHSRTEWAALGVMARATQVILNLVSLWHEKGRD